MKRGRPPANGQPATAWDYRRYIELVQVLATGDEETIRALCEAWGVQPIYGPSGTPYFFIMSTLRALAQHVIEYHRKEREG